MRMRESWLSRFKKYLEDNKVPELQSSFWILDKRHSVTHDKFLFAFHIEFSSHFAFTSSEKFCTDKTRRRVRKITVVQVQSVHGVSPWPRNVTNSSLWVYQYLSRLDLVVSRSIYGQLRRKKKKNNHSLTLTFRGRRVRPSFNPYWATLWKKS